MAGRSGGGAHDRPTVTAVLLVRHGDAVDRASWSGDERRRPLSARGFRQAAALPATLAEHAIERIVSSPHLRCLQSVEPLGTARGLPVETDDALTEGAPFDLVQGLLRRLGDRDTVLCTHGDVVGAVLTDLAHRGWLDGRTLRWPKGSTWVLAGPLLRATSPDGDRDRTGVRYLPPPA